MKQIFFLANNFYFIFFVVVKLTEYKTETRMIVTFNGYEYIKKIPHDEFKQEDIFKETTFH